MAQEHCTQAVRQVLPTLVQIKDIRVESGDTETYGLSVLLCTYKFVACMYMLCDVLHTVAKLQSILQTKDLDLSMVPVMVQTTVGRLKELKDYPSNSTWFKDHLKVFSDQKHLGQMKVQITELDRKSFIQGFYNPYIQGVKHLEWNDLVYFQLSIFDPILLPNEEKDPGQNN